VKELARSGHDPRWMDERRARFERLFRDTYEVVLGYALRRAGPDLAQDVVAETFTIAWRRLDDVPRDPVPWLLGVARRVLANQRRGERRRDALVERLSAPMPEPEPARDTRGSPALQALALLPEHDRELLLLLAWEGLDAAAAAEVLGCSRPSLAVRLHRARRRFAAALADLERLPSTSPTAVQLPEGGH